MINVEKNIFLPTMAQCIGFLCIAAIILGFSMVYQVPLKQSLYWCIALTIIPLTGTTIF